MKTLRMLALTGLLALIAAGCNPFEDPRKLNPKPPWHYWIAPILAGSLLLVCIGLAVGYVVKVVMPKYRGR